MNLQEGNFNFDRFNIYYRKIFNDKKDNINKAIFFIHGKSSHCGYIENIITESLLNDYIVFTLDLPGWGKSSGTRGHIKSYKEYLKVIVYFINNYIKQYDSLFIIGESMGSLLTFYLAQNYNIANLKGIVFCPGIFYVNDFNNLLKLSTLYLGNILFPKYKRVKDRNIEKYTNSQKFGEILDKDPLWERGASIRFLFELNKYIKYMNKNIHSLKYPLLIFQGMKDIYNNPQFVKPIFEKLSNNKNNEIIYFEESRHWLIINDEVEQIKNYILNWVNKID